MAVVDVEATVAAVAPAGSVERGLRWERLRKKLLVWVPAGFVIFLLLVCFVGPLVLPLPSPVGGNVLNASLPVGSPGHLLGTDVNGNDILSRLIYGGRASLTIGITVSAIGLVIGGAIGALSGYLGGKSDTVIMRLLDILIAFPSLVLLLAIAGVLGPSLINTILALTAFSIPATARVARSGAFVVVNKPFVQAAELSGSPWWRIVLRHITPNVLPQLMNFALLGMGIVMVTEGALSFLGLGVPQPEPSWGNMIYDAQRSLSATPLQVLWPSLALLISVMAFNLLGENLRDEMGGR